jgi:uncharacterized protein (TIGR00297 family)
VRRWISSLLLATGVAAVACWRRALTVDGAIAAACVGSITFACGRLPAASALLAFFTSSSALSRVAEGRKRESPLAQAKGAQRDAWQVLANGGVAALCVKFGRGDGLLGALSAAAADTWATELGMLARRPPRLITTLRPVPAGTSGGVTCEGLLASVCGALLVGLSQLPFGGSRRTLRTAVSAGLGGSVVDSLLGATLQAGYTCRECNVLIEEPRHQFCGSPAELERGLAWMTNDSVNALATLAGGCIAMCWTPNAAGHVRGGS